MMQKPPRRLPRWPFVAGVFLILFAVLLALDLSNRGLAWRTFWQLTGEETPAGQLRGMVEWAGRWLRPQPNTQPMALIAHTGMNPYGINTFLQQEVEVAKREQQLQMIADAGFGWIRQEFPWEDIEIHGRGDFTDRRNDVNGDGVVDEIDAWAKYDNIVDLADAYGIQIQARLSNPPQWAQSGPDAGDFAPPVEFDDFVNYAVAVAERYRGRIQYYQILNEPNIFPEWGNQDVDPEAYTDLLCRTYAALKAVDPDILVIDGPLAPTVSLSGRDLNDFIYLQRMYDAGAGDCFDIHSMQGYGLNSGPTDTRMRPTDVNYARNLYIRDLMVANGDADKPIWISEAAWSPVGEPSVSRDIDAYGQYGEVTLEQAARYMPIAYDRAQQEWPWVGVINYWFFKLPSEDRSNEAFYYFRMVEPDFSPLPVYGAMQQYITDEVPTLYIGTHPESHRAILYDDSEVVALSTAELGQAIRTSNFRLRTNGTVVRLRWQGDSPLTVDIDGGGVQTLPLSAPDADGWRQTDLTHELTATYRRITVSSETPFLLDTVRVYDRTVAHLLPTVAALAGVALFAFTVLVSAVWVRVGRMGE
jgi:hypothetical protein